MANKNTPLKSILKAIRRFILINAPIRFVIKVRSNLSLRELKFFSLHWPVTGTIKFKLPKGENVKLFSKGDDYISTQAYWKGYMGYEGASVQLFYYLSKQCSSIIDIGANIGYFSLIGAASNPKAKVIAFEPVGKIFERLNKNISINSLSNITAENFVVGNSETPVKFYIPKTSGMALAGSTKKGWADEAEEITVPSVTLDSYKKYKSISGVNLIKMDCEFHEKEVLEGMKDILREDKPVILMEVLFPEGEGDKGHFAMGSHEVIEQIMRENNYYFYLVSDVALIRLDKLEYNPDERNYLFSTKHSEKVYLSYSDMDALIKTIL